MENSIDTSSLLLARGFGGYGGAFNGLAGNVGGCGGGVLAQEALANGTATKQAIDCNAAAAAAALDRLSDQAEESRRVAQIVSLEKSVTDSEFRSLDRQRDIERLIADGQKEAAKCCCDAKLESCKSHAELAALIAEKAAITDSLILAVEGRANLDKLAETRADLISLKTQVACGCNCPS